MEVLYYLAETYKTDAATFRYKTVADDYRIETPEIYDYKAVEIEIRENLFKRFFENKKGSQVEVWTRIYKKSAIEGIYFPKDVQPAEDTVFTLKVMHRIKNMAIVPLELLFYRDSQTSVMNEGKTEKYVRSHALVARVLHDYFIREKRVQGRDFENMHYYISRIVFKTCISQVLRKVKDKNARKKLLDISHSLVKPLFEEEIFLPESLGIRYALASKMFLNKCYRLAKLFV